MELPLAPPRGWYMSRGQLAAAGSHMAIGISNDRLRRLPTFASVARAAATSLKQPSGLSPLWAATGRVLLDCWPESHCAERPRWIVAEA